MFESKAYVEGFTDKPVSRSLVRINTRLRRLVLPVLLIAVDYIALIAAIWTAYFIRASLLPTVFDGQLPPFHISRTFIYIVIPFAYIFFLHFDRQYNRRLLFWQQAARLFKVSVYAMLFVLVLSYITGVAGTISRTFLLTVWITGFVYQLLGLYAVKKVLKLVGLWQIPIVLIGGGKTADLLIKAFDADDGLGYRVVGLVEDNPDVALHQRYPIIGTFDHAEKAVIRSGVKDVLIAAPGLGREELLELVYRLQPYVDNVTVVPDLFGLPVGDMELDTLFTEKAVLLRIRNNLQKMSNRILKRIFDLTLSTVVLLIITPVLIAIAVIVRIDSPGPIFYAGRRIGQERNTFKCLKFRTMFVDSDRILEAFFQSNPDARQEWEAFAKLKTYDPRVTSVGRFLRRFSLDELPQILNVIAGDMSLVGPRPYLPREEKLLGAAAATILETPPGITGLWQVSGRNDLEFEQRVSLDSWYVRNWSPWLDIMLLFKTVKVVLTGKGAY